MKSLVPSMSDHDFGFAFTEGYSFAFHGTDNGPDFSSANDEMADRDNVNENYVEAWAHGVLAGFKASREDGVG